LVPDAVPKSAEFHLKPDLLRQQKRGPDRVELTALSAQVGGVGLVCRQRREQSLRLGDLWHLLRRR
jgi:hypothetical protein